MNNRYIYRYTEYSVFLQIDELQGDKCSLDTSDQSNKTVFLKQHNKETGTIICRQY